MNKLAILGFSLLGSCIPLGALNAQHIERMCSDTNAAYESGYNNGLERRRLDTSWVAQCAPAWQVAVRDSYQRGFNTGIANAPIVVPVRGGVIATGSTCRFSSDCGSGQSCRADQAGDNVCMGGGYSGDACWFSSDCVAGSCDSRTCR